MACDSTRSMVVLFGGYCAARGVLNDTWIMRVEGYRWHRPEVVGRCVKWLITLYLSLTIVFVKFAVLVFGIKDRNRFYLGTELVLSFMYWDLLLRVAKAFVHFVSTMHAHKRL